MTVDPTRFDPLSFDPGDFQPDDARALPQWWASDNNAYYCDLIAAQLRLRSLQHRARGNHAAANEADAIADLIADGQFDWTY